MRLALSETARGALYRLQTARDNALFVIPSFISPQDRAALGELEIAGLAQVREVANGVISRQQALLTPVGLATDPWRSR